MNSLSVDCTRSMPVERCGVLFTLCLDYKVIIEKKCASGRGIDAKCLFSHTSQKSSIKSSTLSLANSLDWTGFDPNLYSGGSSSTGPTLVEIATARSFILNRGIVTDTMSATPLEPGW